VSELIIVTENARLIDFGKLPGGRELYERLADVFLDAYHAYKEPSAAELFSPSTGPRLGQEVLAR
jgi:hypothetical protein